MYRVWSFVLFIGISLEAFSSSALPADITLQENRLYWVPRVKLDQGGGFAYSPDKKISKPFGRYPSDYQVRGLTVTYTGYSEVKKKVNKGSHCTFFEPKIFVITDLTESSSNDEIESSDEFDLSGFIDSLENCDDTEEELSEK